MLSGEVNRPSEGSNPPPLRFGGASQPASHEKIKSQAGFLALTGKLVVRAVPRGCFAKGGRRAAQFAEGLVERRGRDRSVCVRGERGAAEVVREEVF